MKAWLPGGLISGQPAKIGTEVGGHGYVTCFGAGQGDKRLIFFQEFPPGNGANVALVGNPGYPGTGIGLAGERGRCEVGKPVGEGTGKDGLLDSVFRIEFDPAQVLAPGIATQGVPVGVMAVCIIKNTLVFGSVPNYSRGRLSPIHSQSGCFLGGRGLNKRPSHSWSERWFPE